MFDLNVPSNCLTNINPFKGRQAPKDCFRAALKLIYSVQALQFGFGFGTMYNNYTVDLFIALLLRLAINAVIHLITLFSE